MIIKLSEPVFGQSHANINYRVYDNAVFIYGVYGSLDAEGNFIQETRIQSFSRTITGKELDAFLEAPVTQGLKTEDRGNFRNKDLEEWMSRYGHSAETKTWEDPKEEPEPEAAEPPEE